MKSARLTDKLKEGISTDAAAACEVVIEYPDANIQHWLEAGQRTPCRSHLSTGDTCSLQVYEASKIEWLEESLFEP